MKAGGINNNMEISTNVLVIGSGTAAFTAAGDLCALGHRVILCSAAALPKGREAYAAAGIRPDAVSGPEGITVHAPSEICEFQGLPGGFDVRIRTPEGLAPPARVGAVILAVEPDLHCPIDEWIPGRSERVRSLSWIDTDNNPPVGDSPLTVAFICGFTHHSNPRSQERAVRAARGLAQSRKNQVLFITEEFKVARTGMERLTREAREAGVLFIKLNGKSPRVAEQDSGLEISFYDNALGEEVCFRSDLLILEEIYRPPEGVGNLAENLGVRLDRRGFFQGENIHNQPIYTNRNGIWAVGPARGQFSLEEGLEEARAAALDAHELLDRIRIGPPPGEIISLDKKRCTFCLTCYRLCPHGAISIIARRPVFSALACRSCGICAAECPMNAIELNPSPDMQLGAQVKDVASKRPAGDSSAPTIIAFCCRNSAVEASQAAAFRGLALPPGLRVVSVPCAGRIDTEFIMAAFREGADGVMVLGCHQESCKSVIGNRLAESRVEEMKDALGEVGLQRERILFASLAPAMGAEFAELASRMDKIVRGLGRSPVGKP